MRAARIAALAWVCGGTACSLTASLDDYRSAPARSGELDGVGAAGAEAAPDSGSVSAAGGQGPWATEVCGNGSDDDGDGLSDCADQDCQAGGWRCVPPAQLGWNGPAALYEGAFAAALPGCPADYPLALDDAYDDLSFQPATCSCQCGAPTGVTCDPPTVRFHDSFICSGTLCSSQAGQSNSCLDGGGVCGQDADSLSIESPTSSGGKCAVSGSAPVIAPPAWATRLRSCGAGKLGSGGCANMDVCAPPPVAPFAQDVCVIAVGEHECPAGYPKGRVVYADAEDTRACTACSCSAPQNVNCSATIEWWTNSACLGTPIGQASAPSTCTGGGLGLANSEYYFKVKTSAASGGSCAPTGGQATGSVAPSQPRTVCCAS